MPTTIFWPDDVKHSGVCYGWTKPVLCVAGVLGLSTATRAEQAIQALCRTPEWSFFEELCGSKPVVLGRCALFTDKRGVTEFTIELVSPIEYTIVYYTRHDWTSLRFYSLDGLKLDTIRKPRTAADDALMNLLQHDLTIPPASEDASIFNETTINQFNVARTVDLICQEQQQDTRFRDVVVKGLPTSSSFRNTLSGFSRALSTFCRLPLLPPFQTPLLKDSVAFVDQVDVRAEQLAFFAREIAAVHQRRALPIHLYSARYTNFFNAVWLILNDIIMGVAFGSFLRENHVLLSEILHNFIEINLHEHIITVLELTTSKRNLFDWVQWTLHWLDSWPEGLKLNTELSHFYSHSFSGIVAAWAGMFTLTRSYLPIILYIMGIVSSGGLTFAVSFALDLLSLSTAHISLCYALSTAVYQRALSTAGSLWNLFRGKRYNVLRNRTDSWEYDADQLMLGTILFTLLAFLFPTILAYYSMFAMMRLIVLLIRAGLETLLALLNHFPLFALMLRIKDPLRLPGGVYFEIEETRSGRLSSMAIRTQCIPLSTIFHQYINLLSRLAKHYNPLRLLYCLFSGRYLASIPQYSIRYNKIDKR